MKETIQRQVKDYLDLIMISLNKTIRKNVKEKSPDVYFFHGLDQEVLDQIEEAFSDCKDFYKYINKKVLVKMISVRVESSLKNIIKEYNNGKL